MDVRNLRQVLAINQHRSLSKAAEELGLSQPSLSKSIARLEDELKVPVFVRSAQGSEPTPIGALIVSRAERIMAEVRGLERDAALAAGGEAGLVRLGVSAPLKTAFLPRLLLQIVDRHPSLQLSIDFGDADHLLPLVQARELDMLLCALGPKVEDSGLILSRFLDADVAVVAAPGHPLAEERCITASRLARFRCAGAKTEDFRNATLFGEAACAENLSALMANDYEALLPLALAGRAILVAPAFVVRQAIDEGRLIRLDVEHRFSVTFVTVATAATSASPIMARIARYAHELGDEVTAECGPGRAPGKGLSLN